MKSTSIRIPDHTAAQIEELAKRLDMTQTQVFILAIDRLAARELQQPKR